MRQSAVTLDVLINSSSIVGTARYAAMEVVPHAKKIWLLLLQHASACQEFWVPCATVQVCVHFSFQLLYLTFSISAKTVTDGFSKRRDLKRKLRLSLMDFEELDQRKESGCKVAFLNPLFDKMSSSKFASWRNVWGPWSQISYYLQVSGVAVVSKFCSAWR